MFTANWISLRVELLYKYGLGCYYIACGGVSNHWNGIRTGLEWNGLDWNGKVRNSKITGYVPYSYSNIALQEAILECITGC